MSAVDAAVTAIDEFNAKWGSPELVVADDLAIELLRLVLDGAQPLVEFLESALHDVEDLPQIRDRVCTDPPATTRVVLDLSNSNVELLAHWLTPSSDGLLAPTTLRGGCDSESVAAEGGTAGAVPSPRSPRSGGAA